MPAVYAHALFGKKVLKKLDGKCRDTVNKYKKYYITGLQGPDIVFFYFPVCYNRVNRTGIRIHNEPARVFIEKAKNIISTKGVDSPECAYILGFLCHFMLDSACHPIVEHQMKKTGKDHISIETEFEIYLMDLDGRNPYEFDMKKLLPYDKKMPEHIYRFYDRIRKRSITVSMRLMRISKKILSCKDDARSKLTVFITKLPVLNKMLYPHIICSEKRSGDTEANRELKNMMDETVNQTVALLMEFYDLKEAINSELNINFYGR